MAFTSNEPDRFPCLLFVVQGTQNLPAGFPEASASVFIIDSKIQNFATPKIDLFFSASGFL